MAVTIERQPDPYTPSDNPVTWTFYSDQFAQANFAFLVEVYVNGVLNSQHYPVFPEVDDDTGHFDASEIAMLHCAPPVPQMPDGPAISVAAANDCLIGIKVIEMYGTTIEEHADAENSVRVWKSCLHDEEFVDYSSFDYTMYFPGPARPAPKFLTSLPRAVNTYCGMTEQMFLLFMTQVTELYLWVRLYDSTGTPIINDTANTVAVSNHFTLFNVSPANIIACTSVTEAQFDAAYYYEVWLSDNGTPEHISEIIKIYIDRRCDQYGTKRLHFLQQYGGIDSYSFTKANTKTREITHHSHEKQWGRFNADNEFVYELNQGREMDHLTSSTGKLVLSSDWLGQTTQQYLANELYESPYAFMELFTVGVDDEEDSWQFKRVKILNTAMEEKQKIKESLFQMFVELNLSDSRKSARV